MTIQTTRRMTMIACCVLASAAWANPFSDLSNQEASSGLKAALEQGAAAAVGKLGVADGFLGNEQVKIRLPRALEKARPFLAMTGRAQQLDDLVVSMNRAAESAIPMAKPLLIDAVKSMSVQDAKNILSGGDTSVTDFFRTKTSSQLTVQFRPIVKKVTDRSDLAGQYNGVMGQMGKLGVAGSHGTVEDYVTERALQGLFTMIGEEEKAIRRDPLGSGSKIISKVFGALR